MSAVARQAGVSIVPGDGRKTALGDSRSFDDSRSASRKRYSRATGRRIVRAIAGVSDVGMRRRRETLRRTFPVSNPSEVWAKLPAAALG
jgi:hypothetical protein